jgi:hypothetical protein
MNDLLKLQFILDTVALTTAQRNEAIQLLVNVQQQIQQLNNALVEARKPKDK